MPNKSKGADRADSDKRNEAVMAFVRELNLKRIINTALLFLAFQVMNLFDKGHWENPTVLASIFLVSFVCALYIWLIRKKYAAIVRDKRLGIIVLNSFWIILYICMIPFFAVDINRQWGPMNIILFFSVMVITRLFFGIEGIVACCIFAAVNTVVPLALGAPGSYVILSVSVCLASIALSYFMQQQYVEMIVKLRIENTLDPLTGALNRKGGHRPRKGAA